MKAVVYHGPGDLRVENVDDPVLEEGDVLLGGSPIAGSAGRMSRHTSAGTTCLPPLRASSAMKWSEE